MSRIRIVLVGTKYPRNVGMVSRVMSNYGVQQLFLIRPECLLNLEARQGAAQGQTALESAKIFSDWDSYYQEEPDSLRIALSRRHGKKRASEPLDSLLESPLLSDGRPINLIFGAEDHGLSREDLDKAHRLAWFELPGSLKSMNLSHAVLFCLENFRQKGIGFEPPKPRIQEPVPDPEPFLRRWLEALNFDLDSQSRWNQLTMLKQLIMKAAPTAEEIYKLEMIVQQTLRKLKDPDSKNL